MAHNWALGTLLVLLHDSLWILHALARAVFDLLLMPDGREMSTLMRRMTMAWTLRSHQLTRRQNDTADRVPPDRLPPDKHHGIIHKLQRRITAFTAELYCSSSITAKTHDDHRYDTDSFQIGIDNHASYCMTTSKSDFIATPTPIDLSVKGISGGLRSAYKGTVLWPITDDEGKRHDLKIPNTYLVEGLPIRLLSPQHLAQVMKSNERTKLGTYCVTTRDRVILTWNDRRHQRTVSLNGSNVAVIRSAPDFKTYMAFHSTVIKSLPDPIAFPAHLIPPDDDEESVAQDQDVDRSINPGLQRNTTPSPSQTEEPPTTPMTPVTVGQQDPTNTAIDFSTGATTSVPVVEDDDVDLPRPQEELLCWHYRLGHKPFAQLQQMAKAGDLPKRLATIRPPECAACRFGKATKVPWRTRGEKNRSLRTATRPGECVSVDQLESTTPGLVAQLKGIPTKQRYKCATVYIDHYSRFTFLYLQKSLSSEETVQSKVAFEALAKSMNVTVNHYHADNGRFADNAFVNHVRASVQTITYCGVNAHWQNGIAEKRIRDVQEAARTQILHAKGRWPKAVDTALWPYALRYTVNVDNATINTKTMESPIERFAKTQVKPKLRHFHPFACPTYVLRNELQASQSVPKWETRARVGLYLGPSPKHSRSVALVLNVETGLVSPQYHVRFDNLFETVKEIDRRTHYLWQQKCHFVRKPPQPRQPREPPEEQAKPPPPEPDKEQAATPPPVADAPDQSPPTEDDDITPPTASEGDDDESIPADTNEADDEPTAPAPAVTTRSGRTVRFTERYLEAQQQRQQGIVNFAVPFEALDQDMYCEEDRLSHLDDPVQAMKATSDPDTMYYHEAMKEPDADQFRAAMRKEVQDHTERKHWEPILRSNVPKGTRILPAVWSMKRKRKISTREIYKWKARLNLGGHKQRAFLDVDTYAPALSWTTIRLFLVLSVLNGWSTRQIDFVLAYPQAKVPRPTYMELPKGIDIKGLDPEQHVLDIKRNIYGGLDAGRTWFLHLKAGLEAIGFTQSKIDDCVFYRGTTIFIVYTDDGILIDPDPKKIDEALNEMKQSFNVEDEGNLQDYLGVKVEKQDDGTFSFTQPHLIDSILSDVGLLDPRGNPKPTANRRSLPAMTSVLLGPDKEGRPFEYEWGYRSVIGKLNFLEKSTRPDISFPTHQCARFMSNPKQSHGEAIKHIARYLLHTRGKGYHIKPDKEKSFECYVDASFLGDWDKRIAGEDPDTAKSRTGFVVKYAGAPLFWQSKMQTQFALSSAEAEYIALSAAARYTISVSYLLQELRDRGIDVDPIPKIHCTMFEDNSAALEIANVPKMRPRTRHINVVYHHFRNEVANGRMSVKRVDTDYQQADMLTKQCEEWRFIRHRKAIMGW